jgi:hypothetical protein
MPRIEHSCTPYFNSDPRCTTHPTYTLPKSSFSERQADYQTGQSVAFFARRVSETEVEEQKLDCVVSACQRWYDQLVAYLEGLDGELQPNQARFSEWCDFSQVGRRK